MAANKRIYFANQQVAFKPVPADEGDEEFWNVAHGVQSVAVTTTFNLEQAFELGQLAIYENIEGVPDIEITATKVLDGYALLYHLATDEQSHTHGPTLAGRSNASAVVALGIWPDTNDSASSAPSQQMEASGMFASSVSYNFPLEDNFTEDITLVGNNKAWLDMTDKGSNSGSFTGCPGGRGGWQGEYSFGAFASNDDEPLAAGSNDLAGGVTGIQEGGINRRENLSFALTAADLASEGSKAMGGHGPVTRTLFNQGGWDYTRLPLDIPGVATSGFVSPKSAANEVHLQSISVSTDLGREELFELGTRQPYARVVTFPVEVTCDIEVLSVSGDQVNALADGCGGTVSDPCTGITDNLSNQTIRIATCEGTRIFLGSKNKLSSVNYGGGDAGGGNVTVTYSYTTFNDFTVLHPQDPNISGTGWWMNRGAYLK